MEIKLLDHGYVKLVERWGSDERIIEAARMSTDKGFQGWGSVVQCSQCGLTPKEANEIVDIERRFCSANDANHSFTATGPVGDEKLLAYLYNHKHMTPFEMAGMIIEVQAPIFVFREWHRHRTQSYNELSSRYTPLPDMFYMPPTERLRFAKQSNKNKQSSNEFDSLSLEEIGDIHKGLEMTYKYCRDSYDGLLRRGIAREIARLVIPVAQYSRMRASANLRNWLSFLTLRMSYDAQWEIRQYANAVGELIKKAHPRTWELFVKDGLSQELK